MEEKDDKRSRGQKWTDYQINGSDYQRAQFYGVGKKNEHHLNQPVTIRWTEPTWNRQEWEAQRAELSREDKKLREKGITYLPPAID